MVSTSEPHADTQFAALRDFVVSDTNIYQEEAFERTVYRHLLATLKPGDTLAVQNIDLGQRLRRDAQADEVYKRWLDEGHQLKGGGRAAESITGYVPEVVEGSEKMSISLLEHNGIA